MTPDKIEQCLKSGEVVYRNCNIGGERNMTLRGSIVKIYPEAQVCNLSFVSDHPGLNRYRSAFYDQIEEITQVEEEVVINPLIFLEVGPLDFPVSNADDFNAAINAQRISHVFPGDGDYVIFQKNVGVMGGYPNVDGLEFDTAVVKIPRGGRGIVIGNSIHERWEIEQLLFVLMKSPL